MFHGLTPLDGDKKPGRTDKHVNLGPPRTTIATLSVASVRVADFAQASSPAALDVAFTVGHDRDPAYGCAAIAPAMASSNTSVPASATGLRQAVGPAARPAVPRAASTAGLQSK